MKKSIKVLLAGAITAIAGVVCAISLFASTAPSKDSDDYYVIKSKDDLIWLSNEVNQNKNQYIKAKLANDIVFNSGVMTSGSTGATVWVPLGGTGTTNNGKIINFRGVIDGQGHTISGLYCTDTYLAGIVSMNLGTIRNLGVVNSYFYSKIDPSDDTAFSGSFAAQNQGVIENCYAINTKVDGEYVCGGIAAMGDPNARIANCYTSCDVSSTLASSASKYRKYADAICYYGDCGSVSNVFWEEGKKTSYIGAAASYTKAMAASGALCYNLNKGGGQYYQNVDSGQKDQYPVLDPSHSAVMYKDGSYTNGGSGSVVTTEAPTQPTTEFVTETTTQSQGGGQTGEFIYGSANAESKLTASDAALILQKVLNDGFKMPIEYRTSNYQKYIDVDNDGMITASDALLVLQKVLDENVKFPVEK